MTLHVFLHVVAEFLSSVSQSTMLCNIPDIALHLDCLVIPEAPSEYFIHQESSLPQCGQNPEYFWPPSAYSFHQGPGIIIFSFMASWNIARILLGNAGLPWTIPSTSNHKFLLQGQEYIGHCKPLSDYFVHQELSLSCLYYCVKVMLVIACLSFTIQSIRNRFFLLQHIFNKSMVLLVLPASLSRFHPTGICSFPFILCLTRSGSYRMMLTPPLLSHVPGTT